jgi:uncharacterized membrane protein YjdF
MNMDSKEQKGNPGFWPAFLITHALFFANWIIVWSGLGIPHRVYWFFEIIPVVEGMVLLAFAIFRRKFALGIVTALVIQVSLCVPQLFFLSMKSGLGHDTRFFK